MSKYLNVGTLFTEYLYICNGTDFPLTPVHLQKKCKFYKKVCKFYTLKCKFYRFKCKFYRKKCTFYRLKFNFYILKCKFYRKSVQIKKKWSVYVALIRFPIMVSLYFFSTAHERDLDWEVFWSNERNMHVWL